MIILIMGSRQGNQPYRPLARLKLKGTRVDASLALLQFIISG